MNKESLFRFAGFKGSEHGAGDLKVFGSREACEEWARSQGYKEGQFPICEIDETGQRVT